MVSIQAVVEIRALVTIIITLTQSLQNEAIREVSARKITNFNHLDLQRGFNDIEIDLTSYEAIMAAIRNMTSHLRLVFKVTTNQDCMDNFGQIIVVGIEDGGAVVMIDRYSLKMAIATLYSFPDVTNVLV